VEEEERRSRLWRATFMKKWGEGSEGRMEGRVMS